MSYSVSGAGVTGETAGAVPAGGAGFAALCAAASSITNADAIGSAHQNVRQSRLIFSPNKTTCSATNDPWYRGSNAA